MLLGIARTADLAGWNTGSNQVSSLAITVPVTTDLTKAYVAGYYYQDFSAITATTGSSYSTEWNQWDTTGTGLFNQTGLTNSPQLTVRAVTFKLGTGWGNYSVWNAFGRVNQNSCFWQNSIGTNLGRAAFVIQTSNTTGTVNFNGTMWDAGAVSSGIPLTVSSIQSTYANRWLAFVTATSTTTSTFANWTGGTITARNWCERSILVDIASQTIIGQADQVAPVATGSDNTMDFSTQTYGLYTGVNPFISQGLMQQTGTSSATFNATPYYKLSDWVTVGNTFDPVTYWPQITGETPQATVNSVQGWFSTNSTSAGTATTFGTPPSPATRINVSAATRQPAGVYQYIINPYGSSPAPVYTPYTGT
jgi:hypothetical protein